MEPIERKAVAAAREQLPAGFYIVRDGPVYPTDLIWSWTSGEWIRADSDDWTQTVTLTNAGDCVAVARRPGFDDPKFAGAPRRTYKMPPAINADAGVTIATPKKALPDPGGQISLF